MEQFGVHANPDPESSQWAPYLLVLQCDLLRDLATTVVAPLIDEARFGTPASILNPVFAIRGRRFVLSTAEMAGISRSELGEPIASLSSSREEIIAAVDFLFTGI